MENSMYRLITAHIFLMLVKDYVVTDNTHTNALRLPNKRAKDLQCYIAYQKFQSTVNSDLEALKRYISIYNGYFLLP